MTPAVGGWHQEQDNSFTSPANSEAARFVLFITCNFCGLLLTANFDDLVYDQSPLAVTLSSFRAVRSHRGVAVRWRTGTEVDTLGFNVFRQQGGKRVRLNRRLLPALGRVAGSSYSFLDRRAPRGAVRYWLQDVSTSGVRTWHGPVRTRAA